VGEREFSEGTASCISGELLFIGERGEEKRTKTSDRGPGVPQILTESTGKGGPGGIGFEGMPSGENLFYTRGPHGKAIDTN